MLLGIFTKKTLFFDYFDKHTFLVKEAAEKFRNSLTEPIDISSLMAIKPLEHDADVIIKEASEALHRTFITPFDRDLIFRLIAGLDDVIDCIETAADCLLIYHIHKPTPDLIVLADILSKGIGHLEVAVKELRNLKKVEAIQDACTAVDKCEHDADDALRLALGRLFDEEPNAKEIIKWKEIYEVMETATDRCADVIDVIQTILLENN